MGIYLIGEVSDTTGCVFAGALKFGEGEMLRG